MSRPSSPESPRNDRGRSIEPLGAHRGASTRRALRIAESAHGRLEIRRLLELRQDARRYARRDAHAAGDLARLLLRHGDL